MYAFLNEVKTFSSVHVENQIKIAQKIFLKSFFLEKQS